MDDFGMINYESIILDGSMAPVYGHYVMEKNTWKLTDLKGIPIHPYPHFFALNIICV